MILQNHKFVTDAFSNAQNIEYFYGKRSVLE